MAISRLLFGAKKSDAPSGGGGGAATASPAATAAAHEQALASLGKVNTELEKQNKRRQYLEQRIAQELVNIKAQMAKNNKRGALLHLKRRKAAEKQIGEIDGMISNLEQMKVAAESQMGRSSYFDAVAAGKTALQATMKVYSPDAVQDILDDARDVMRDAEQMSDLVSQPLGNMEDDDELTAELDGLMADELLGAATALPPAGVAAPAGAAGVPAVAATAAATVPLDLPAPPTHLPAAAQATAATAVAAGGGGGGGSVDDELAALEAGL